MAEESKDLSEKVPDVRRYAVDKLAEHLDVGVTLAHHCELLAGKTKGDRLGPVYAAARLMRANAAVAEALATVGGIERRRRSIIERIQPLDPKAAELNSGLQQEKSTASDHAAFFSDLYARIERAAHMRPGVDGTAEHIAQIRADLEQELTKLENAGLEEGHG